MKKRKIDVAVISDVHLGTPQCRAEELIAYLSSIEPATLVLNGDIVDAWNLNRDFFPPAHVKVLKKFMSMAASGTQVYYLTGNRDGVIRKFIGSRMGNFQVRDRLVLNLNGCKAWIFHGDIFDWSPQKTRWMSRLGSFGYRCSAWMNRLLNRLRKKLGKNPHSLARLLRTTDSNRAKAQEFQQTAVDLALRKGYTYVVCGHTHQPRKEWSETPKGRCLYLNSGDWVENLTALEFAFNRWKLYRYQEDKLSPFFADEALKEMDFNALMNSIMDPKGSQKQEKAKDGLEGQGFQ
ncbi:UDP-2,3-diacylglucosamine diphosphatase [Robiginitalea sediminis]|uniref:UDP-2,3-diacylglucosamine diphosphatase n=1 Tax=Robiginitalea sediminis TaxID=1982593 RepID=UPI000B4C04F6|nr:UDP-2,3-diacylglucosamine diphosphatase [Robiginitalea sediminis]